MKFSRFFLLSCACVTGFSASSHAFIQGNFFDAVSGTVPTWHRAVSNDLDLEKAESFVDGLAQDAIGFLSDESLNAAQKAAKFKKLLRARFDMDTIGRFALGRQWRNATDAQREEYLTLFRTMVVDVYTDRFNEYQGQDIEVVSSRYEGKRDVVVSSLVLQDSGPNIKVDWRLRHKDGHYKVIDILVEGVSMSLTQRSEFASVIQRGGGDIDVLLDHLKK